MPSADKYLKIKIGDNSVQVSDPEQLPISITYSLEDPDNFQDKTSAQALEITVPATLMNDVAGNTMRNADMKDLTSDEVFKSYQPFVIDENGFEIMSGKAFLKSATHDSKPQAYIYDLYGDNADWVIDFQLSTLFDFLQHINFTFSKDIIIASWAFDGTDESLPYVFAPVRYRLPMGGEGQSLDVQGNPVATPIDDNMLPIYMKPSLSKYWILFFAFKTLGYRIQSDFMDSEFFRRQVMPWTWGQFLGSDGTLLNTHLFLAKSPDYPVSFYYDAPNGKHEFFWDMNITLTPTGAFENNPGDYVYDPTAKMGTWKYNTPDYGVLDATFDVQMQIDAALNGSTSYVYVSIYWYKNGTKVQESVITNLGGTTFGGKSDIGIKDVFYETQVVLNDTISIQAWVSMYTAKLGFARIDATVLAFQNAFSTPLGGTINFQNYTGLRNYAFLDFLRGIIDEFNLCVNTDPTNKIVFFEPTHPYSITNDLTATTSGYFKNDYIDWNGKGDYSKVWQMDNFSDYNREVTFKYKDDGNDGILKLIQDRNINTLAMGKYVFPSRFTIGTTAVENRFFSATMHYDVVQWKALTGVTPQMVCLIPENVSNTSNSASDNTFQPKSCYYKGNISGVGGWKFDGTTYETFPFMFAVNYQAGGQNDPILSYSDEKISDGSGGWVIGKGLLKRFYWQRFAIMRNGQFYTGWFKLKNVDVANQLHREYKSFGGHRWELIQIMDYRPLVEQSTQVLMRRWAPVSTEDYDFTYPSQENLLAVNVIVLPNSNQTTPSTTYLQDLVYAQLKCLIADIPTI